MEPNVDRGMWSVVALLAAIVIGGVVLLAFPRISGKIANSMDDSVNKAFNGEVPEWAKDKEFEMIKDIKFDKNNKFREDRMLNYHVMAQSEEINAYIKKAPAGAMEESYTRNYLNKSNDVGLYTNLDKFPIQIEKKDGYQRIKRTQSEDDKRLTIYSNVEASNLDRDFFSEVSPTDKIYVSFEVRASEKTDATIMAFRTLKEKDETGYRKEQKFESNNQKVTIGTEWQTIHLELDPKDIPWDQTALFRVSPFEVFKDNIMDFHLDIRNYRIGKEKGEWQLSFEDTPKSEMTSYYVYYGGPSSGDLKLYSFLVGSSSDTEKYVLTTMDIRSVGKTTPDVSMHGKNDFGDNSIKPGVKDTYKRLTKFYKNRTTQFRIESKERENSDIRLYVDNIQIYVEK